MGDVIFGRFGQKPAKDAFQDVSTPLTIRDAQKLLDEFLQDPNSDQTRSLARQFVIRGKDGVEVSLSGALALEAHGQTQDAIDYCALIHRAMREQGLYEHIGLPLLTQAKILYRSKDGMDADLYALEAARSFMEQGLMPEATATLELIPD